MINPPEPAGVVVGLAFAALIAYSLYTGEAAFQHIAGFYTAKKQDDLRKYWLVVAALFFMSAISFLEAFGLVVF